MLQRAEQPVALTGVEASRTFFAPSLVGRTTGGLLVAHLDGEARCIHLASYDGDAQSDGLPVRAIINDAVRFASAGVVLARNHPCGDAQPSPSDKEATRALAVAAEAIDLTLVDHLVFGVSDCSSFRRLGLL